MKNNPDILLNLETKIDSQKFYCREKFLLFVKWVNSEQKKKVMNTWLG